MLLMLPMLLRQNALNKSIHSQSVATRRGEPKNSTSCQSIDPDLDLDFDLDFPTAGKT